MMTVHVLASLSCLLSTKPKKLCYVSSLSNPASHSKSIPLLSRTSIHWDFHPIWESFAFIFTHKDTVIVLPLSQGKILDPVNERRRERETERKESVYFKELYVGFGLGGV